MPEYGSRDKALRGLHAEARKRGLDHDALHEIALERFQRGSLRDLSVAQIQGWANELRQAQAPRSAASRRRQGTAGRKTAGKAAKVVELVGAKELELIGGYAEALGWDRARLDGFIRRQLGEHGRVRTVGDANKVIDGLRAMYRRSVNREP